MPKATQEGPTCPGCGYAIFGIRNMRCPECGRVLDVRDFAVDDAEQRGAARRYERNSVLGGLGGILLVLLFLAPLVLLIGAMARFGRIPLALLIMAGFLVVALIGVLTHTGESIGSWFRSRK